MGLVKCNFYIITYAKIQHSGSSSGIMFIPCFIKTVSETETGHTHAHTIHITHTT